MIKAILLATIIPFLSFSHGCPSFEYTFQYKLEGWKYAHRVVGNMRRGARRDEARRVLADRITREVATWPQRVILGDDDYCDEFHEMGVPCH